MSFSAEWVSAISAAVGAVGVLFVGYQAYLAKNQNMIALKALEADHERSRRETALRVLDRWTESLDKAQPSARSLVESFNI